MSFIDLSKSQLMLNDMPYPASTLRRAFKYIKKGFSICPGEISKIINAVRNSDEEDFTEEEWMGSFGID